MPVLPAWNLAPPSWSPDQPNPFAADGAYRGWSCFRLTEAQDDRLRNGCEPSGLYVAALGRAVEDAARRLGDFLRYEPAHGRRVIVAGFAEEYVREALAVPPEPTVPREDDPRWLVHATPAESWPLVRACGELRAFALQQRGATERSIGEILLNDPPDYAQHVGLGEIDRVGPEFVLACRQAGKMLPDPDTEYMPGARLYFDAHRIIRDGLGVRDGLHTLKVRHRLPLDPYLVAAVTVADLPPLPEGERWRTTVFRDRANDVFWRRVAGPG